MRRLQLLRLNSFRTQQGRCYYCGFYMWLHSPAELHAKTTFRDSYRCTAEHLIARKDGGKDRVDNVVAACRLCNSRRHGRKGPAPSPEIYRRHVRKQVSKGKWRPNLPSGISSLKELHHSWGQPFIATSAGALVWQSQIPVPAA